MTFIRVGIALALSTMPLSVWADCLSGSDVAQNSTLTFFEQISTVSKQDSSWRIEGKNPYTRNNFFNDAGVNLDGRCSLIDNVLDMDFSLYGLTWYSVRPLAEFEKDDRRSRAVVEQLRLAYTVSDSVQIDVGKLRIKPGLFYLRSPGSLISQYYGGFKPTRLYDPQLRSVYQSTPWAATITADNREHALSLTFVPKLATIDQYYLSSGNWSESQRGNSSEAWLLSYTSHQFSDHTPGIRVLLGHSRSVALSDSYSYTPQMTLNGEVAYHGGQRWRHLSDQKRQELEHYQFPSSLYDVEDKSGVELAVGGQYTADNFSIFGLEYYFQSEGYSRSQWDKQKNLLHFLNTQTGYAALDDAFDSYKYLMSSEINNVGNKGMLQGKHYFNAWSSVRLDGGATFQPYWVINLTDASSLAGLHFSTPLSALSDKLETYSGIYASLGRAHTEFALFGENVGLYIGFKYYL